MPKAKQQSFQDKEFQKPNQSFGGSLLKNSNAKTKRPLDSKLPIHLVLRANQSRMRLPKHFKTVNQTVEKVARHHGVRVYRYANVGNHLHLVIKIPRRAKWAAYIRELTGRIAQQMHGFRKAKEKFWAQKPFTRVIGGWRRAFRIAMDYVHLNVLEAEGAISRRQERALRELRSVWDH